MKTNLIRLLFIFSLVFALSSCAYKAGYNPTYLPDEKPDPLSSHEILLLMDDEEEGFVFTGSPTSLTGGATTLELPLGAILKEVAEEILADRFAGGVEFSNTMETTEPHELAFHPCFKHFEFRYNQLKNFGFAITPEVNFKLEVEFVDKEGSTLFSKVYETGYVSGETYMISGSPGEEVSQILHQTLYEVLKESFIDARSAVVAHY
jgi:hypothetical protein